MLGRIAEYYLHELEGQGFAAHTPSRLAAICRSGESVRDTRAAIVERRMGLIEREAKRNQLLSALADHALIKAAVIFDRHGNVRAQVGSSRVVGTTDRFTDGSLKPWR